MLCIGISYLILLGGCDYVVSRKYAFKHFQNSFKINTSVQIQVLSNSINLFNIAVPSYPDKTALCTLLHECTLRH